MELHQLREIQKRYDVLKDSSKFMLNTEFGMTLSSEIIEYEFESAFNEIGITSKQCAIPTVYKNFCCLHDGFFVQWQYLGTIEKGYPVMGSVKFNSTYNFVTQNITPEGKRLFLFDDFLDMWKVYIELTGDPNTHKLYYENFYEQRFYPMTITASQYIEKAALCRGLTNWHEFFFEDKNYESDEGNRIRFRKELETIFSDVLFEDFINCVTLQEGGG
jgi:hypothetical protein